MSSSSRGHGSLFIDFVPMPVFKSGLEPWDKDGFRTRFPKGVGEDAVVTFAVAGGRVTGVTMKALSPLADFSYGFQHLNFSPVSHDPDVDARRCRDAFAFPHSIHG